MYLHQTARNTSSVPLVPAWVRKPRTAPWLCVETLVRTKMPDGRLGVYSAGLNISTIHDFCGGMMATSFNIRFSAFNPRWMEPSSAATLACIPLVDDLVEGGADAVSAFWDTVEDLPAPVSSSVAPNDGVAKMLVHSAMVRTLGYAINGNRLSISYWDKRRGCTGALFTWLAAPGSPLLDRWFGLPGAYMTNAVDDDYASDDEEEDDDGGYRHRPEDRYRGLPVEEAVASTPIAGVRNPTAMGWIPRRWGKVVRARRFAPYMNDNSGHICINGLVRLKALGPEPGWDTPRVDLSLAEDPSDEDLQLFRAGLNPLTRKYSHLPPYLNGLWYGM